MKSIVVFLAVLMLAGIAWADPRMEINDNFCHMILDPNNTDNEIFVAGCDAQIATVDGVATGYIKMVRWMPREEVEAIIPVRRLSFSSDESDTACAMVESNGTQYNSNDWESQIIVRRPFRKINRVVYRLICRNGQE